MKPPARIDLDRAMRTLTLHWPDGGAQRFSHATLRRACPCAACRRVRLAGWPVLAREDLSLIELQSMGYGVQLVFGDGHAQGIFPWSYLEQLKEVGEPAATIE